MADKPVSFHNLEYGKLYRLVGAFHVWDGHRWVGSPTFVVAGLYRGQEPGNPDRYLFDDMDATYGLTDTTPVSSQCFNVKPRRSKHRYVIRSHSYP